MSLKLFTENRHGEWKTDERPWGTCTCQQENKLSQFPHYGRKLTETGEVVEAKEADVQEDTDFEGVDISFVLREEIILEDTLF